MPLRVLGQIAIPVSDVDRSESFYGETSGLPKLFRFGDLAFFDCSGIRLMLEGSQDPIKTSEGICHYFKVDDILQAVLDLKSRGLSFEDDPHLIARMPDHELWMTFFKDPDGHMLALMEERRE